LRLIPASAGVGRYFVHVSDPLWTNQEELIGGVDESEEKMLPATIMNVSDTTLSTTLSVGGAKVRTVEHIISALEGLGVDNCRMELEGGNEVVS
jgi:UDP-3-O-[3-hydroxymyristoyl] N-acetylglucosamine deacetylase